MPLPLDNKKYAIYSLFISNRSLDSEKLNSCILPSKTFTSDYSDFTLTFPKTNCTVEKVEEV